MPALPGAGYRERRRVGAGRDAGAPRDASKSVKKAMKARNNKCPLVPPDRTERCPLTPAKASPRAKDQPSVVVVRTERRSWMALAITGFGALLLRYFKTVRERSKTENKKQKAKT